MKIEIKLQRKEENEKRKGHDEEEKHEKKDMKTWSFTFPFIIWNTLLFPMVNQPFPTFLGNLTGILSAYPRISLDCNEFHVNSEFKTVYFGKYNTFTRDLPTASDRP